MIEEDKVKELKKKIAGDICFDSKRDYRRLRLYHYIDEVFSGG